MVCTFPHPLVQDTPMVQEVLFLHHWYVGVKPRVGHGKVKFLEYTQNHGIPPVLPETEANFGSQSTEKGSVKGPQALNTLAPNILRGGFG